MSSAQFAFLVIVAASAGLAVDWLWDVFRGQVQSARYPQLEDRFRQFMAAPTTYEAIDDDNEAQ